MNLWKIKKEGEKIEKDSENGLPLFLIEKNKQHFLVVETVVFVVGETAWDSSAMECSAAESSASRRGWWL